MNRHFQIPGIAEREQGRLQAMAALSFVLMAGLAFGRASRDALFIKSAGVDNLPLMYVVNGLLMAGFAALYARFVPRFSLHRALSILCISFAALVVSFRGLLAVPNESVHAVIPYAIWSVAQLYQILLLMHFWTFCNHVFDPREARRIFPLVGGVGLAGMIAGSLVTPVLVSRLGSTNILFLWAGCAFGAGAMVSRAVRSIRESGIAMERGVSKGEGFASEIGELWRIPLLRLLIYIAFPMWIVAWLIDFQFLQTLDSVYKEQDALAGFLGLFNGLTSLAGLLIQFFLTGRLIQLLGVGGAAVVYPAVMTTAAAGLVVRNALPAGPGIVSPRNLLGAAGKLGDETVFVSLHDSVLSLLFNSIPEEKRARARALLAGVMEPAATSLAGVILMLLTSFSVPPLGTAVITISLSTAWLFLSLRLRRTYLAALVNNLNSRNVDLQRTAFRALSQNQDAAAQQLLLSALSSGDEEMALFALGTLNPADETVASSLCRYVFEASGSLKEAMIEALARSGYLPAAAVFERQLRDGTPAAREASLRGLIALGLAPAELIRRLIDDPDPGVAASAVQFALGSDRLRGAALARIDQMLSSRKNEEAAAAARILQKSPVPARTASLVKLLSRNDHDIQAEAVRALGQLRTKDAFRRLAWILSRDLLVLPARESLLAAGPVALPALHSALLKQAGAQEQFKINLIECIGEIADPRSVEVLSRFLTKQPILVENAAALALSNIRLKFLTSGSRSVHDANDLYPAGASEQIRSAYFAIVENWQHDLLAAESLHAANRSHHLDLLADAMRRFSRLRLEAALRFLELMWDPRSIRSLSGDLLAGDMRARAESLEALENTCAEAHVIVKAVEAGSHNGRELLTLRDVIARALTRNYPPWIAACAAHAAGLTGVKSVEKELLGALAHSAPHVSFCAHKALQRIRSTHLPRRPRKDRIKEIDNMDATMERFLFLRSVPLFSDVDGTDLQWINEITHEQGFRGRQTIFREGDPGESLYIIISGSVRVYKGQKGKEITIDILQERDCFGEMAILDQEPRSASVTTMKHARLLVIHRSDFQRLLLARPRISFSLFKTMSRRVREANARFLSVRKGAE